QDDHPQGRHRRGQESLDAPQPAARGQTRGARRAGQDHPRLRQASMIATSPDGQWAAVKRGREVMLLAGGAGPAAAGPAAAGPAVAGPAAAGPIMARIDLPTDDADLVLVGSPS